MTAEEHELIFNVYPRIPVFASRKGGIWDTVPYWAQPIQMRNRYPVPGTPQAMVMARRR